MIDVFTVLLLIATAMVLLTLAVIDFKTGLLPNVYNGLLALLALGFHALSGFETLSPLNMIAGAAMGAGLLWTIRLVANWYYKQDALGLGDVKLLGAAGLWLGPHHILSALVIGALAGLVHGGLVIAFSKIKQKQTQEEIGPLSTFSIPAGPGFCFGIFAVGVWFYVPFVATLFS